MRQDRIMHTISYSKYIHQPRKHVSSNYTYFIELDKCDTSLTEAIVMSNTVQMCTCVQKMIRKKCYNARIFKQHVNRSICSYDIHLLSFPIIEIGYNDRINGKPLW